MKSPRDHRRPVYGATVTRVTEIQMLAPLRQPGDREEPNVNRRATKRNLLRPKNRSCAAGSVSGNGETASPGGCLRGQSPTITRRAITLRNGGALDEASRVSIRHAFIIREATMVAGALFAFSST